MIEKFFVLTTPSGGGIPLSRIYLNEMYENAIIEGQSWCRISPIPLSRIYLNGMSPSETVLERWEDTWG